MKRNKKTARKVRNRIACLRNANGNCCKLCTGEGCEEWEEKFKGVSEKNEIFMYLNMANNSFALEVPMANDLLCSTKPTAGTDNKQKKSRNKYQQIF